MLENYFVDNCELIETSRNDFGDEIEGVTASLSCRWRDITQIRRGTHEDVSDADALVHFPATASVARGSILKYNGEYYQVEQITLARRLGEMEVQFIKCQVTFTNLGLS